MNKLRQYILFSILLFCYSLAFSAPGLKSLTNPIPNPPKISAKSLIMIDATSQKVLAEQNADEKVEPASLTKIMTVYVLNQAIKNGSLSLDQEVPISKKAWKMPGSRMFVEVGKKVPLRELLKGIIIQSGNDASVAAAEFLASTESAFADLMNMEAKRLGMNNTHFVNATGLPHPNHYTTARDMSILATAIIRDFPSSYKLYSQKWYTYNNIKQPNRNRLLWHDDFVDGMKTGHTDSAGFCLVASAKRKDMRIISVLIGAKSDDARTKQSARLLSYGFRFFETHKLYGANDIVTEEKAWMGEQNSVNLGVPKDLVVTVANGQYRNIDAKLYLPRVLKAPIKKGQQIGSIVIKVGDEELTSSPLVALSEVKESGFFGRIADYLKLTLHNSLDKNQSSSDERIEKAKI